MSGVSESDKCVEQLMARFGLAADPASVRTCGRGLVFRFREPEQAIRTLSNNVVFATGRLGILHGRQLGGVVSEYRSYTDGNGFSLHIVIGRNGQAFADIDRFNPYQGPVQLLLHGVLELCPYIFQSLRRRALAFAGGVANGRSQNG